MGEPVSAIYTQRMLIRLLFDPDLVERIHHTPENVMGWESLSDEEKKDILSQDKRLFRADPHLRARHLQAYLREFPLSVFFQSEGQVWKLQQFFSSEEYHLAIHEWSSVLAAFKRYLTREASEELRPLIEFENELCRCRQQHGLSSEDTGSWCLRRGNLVFKGPEGFCEAYNRVLIQHGLTGSSIIEKMAVPHAHVWKPHDGSPCWILLERQEDGSIQMGEVPHEMGELLNKASTPIAERLFVESALQLGADDANEALEILLSFEGEGLIVRC